VVAAGKKPVCFVIHIRRTVRGSPFQIVPNVGFPPNLGREDGSRLNAKQPDRLRPTCGRSSELYNAYMQRADWQYPTKIALAVLAEQSLFDWTSNGLIPAVQHLPLRSGALSVVVVGWAAFAAWRRDRKQRIS
jgi:hypothetical protein